MIRNPNCRRRRPSSCCCRELQEENLMNPELKSLPCCSRQGLVIFPSAHSLLLFSSLSSATEQPLHQQQPFVPPQNSLNTELQLLIFFTNPHSWSLPNLKLSNNNPMHLSAPASSPSSKFRRSAELSSSFSSKRTQRWVPVLLLS